MSWPEVLRALHLLLPFIREMFFGKRRVFDDLSKDQINSMVSSLGLGFITLVSMAVLTSAIKKEAALQEEIRRLVPYEEEIIRLNEEYGLDLMTDGILPIKEMPLPEEPMQPTYESVWQAYENLLKENQRLIDQCFPDINAPPPSKPRPTPDRPKRPKSEKDDGGDNKRIIENLKGLWK